MDLGAAALENGPAARAATTELIDLTREEQYETALDSAHDFAARYLHGDSEQKMRHTEEETIGGEPQAVLLLVGPPGARHTSI